MYAEIFEYFTVSKSARLTARGQRRNLIAKIWYC